MRLLTFFLLFIATGLSAQDRPLTYFSQVSYGRSSYGAIDNEIIQLGDINGDAIADIAYGGPKVFYVGYGRLENGRLHIDMEPVSFFEQTGFSRGQLVDIDSDGDLDFTIRPNRVNFNPSLNYYFANQEDSIPWIPDTLPELFPAKGDVFFGQFNEDEITDAYYTENDKKIILDGATEVIHEPFPVDLSSSLMDRARHVDLNADGLVDFYLQVDNFPGTDTIVHEIFINEGDYVFTKYATRLFLTARDFGDFDGDGILDIIGGGSTDGNLKYTIKSNLMSADAAEIFEHSIAGQNYDPELYPYDLNEDGYDDLLVFTGDTVYFCKNNQDQTFETFSFPQENPNFFSFTSDPSWPIGTIIGEHGGGVPVLYYLDFDGSNFTVERSSGNISPPIIGEPPYYHRTVILDVDQDGERELGISSGFELLAAELGADGYKEYTGHQFDIAKLAFFSSISSADFNNDGILDLVFAPANDDRFLQMSFGQSNGIFSTPITLADSFNLCFKIGVADFDGNGFIDFAASGGLGDSEKFSVFLNQDGTEFIENRILNTRHEGWNIIDPDTNGIADLAISNLLGNFTKIYMNDGTGSLDSTQLFFGSVTKNEVINSSYLVNTNGELMTISADGTENTIISSGGEYFSYRISNVMDYNLDGLPDVMYTETDFLPYGNDTTYLVLSDTLDDWEIRSFPNTFILGVEDMDGDGTQDVLWQIGSQLWVELMGTPVWSSIVEPEVTSLSIFPNPASTVLHFGEADWQSNDELFSMQIYNATGQLVRSENQTERSIDIHDLVRGSYFLLLKNKAGEMFGGSFIRL